MGEVTKKTSEETDLIIDEVIALIKSKGICIADAQIIAQKFLGKLQTEIGNKALD